MCPHFSANPSRVAYFLVFPLTAQVRPDSILEEELLTPEFDERRPVAREEPREESDQAKEERKQAYIGLIEQLDSFIGYPDDTIEKGNHVDGMVHFGDTNLCAFIIYLCNLCS